MQEERSQVAGPADYERSAGSGMDPEVADLVGDRRAGLVHVDAPGVEARHRVLLRAEGEVASEGLLWASRPRHEDAVRLGGPVHDGAEVVLVAAGVGHGRVRDERAAVAS